MVIPACRFHFYMLTNHVEAQILGFLNVVCQCFISGCSVESIGPPTLVERTEMENRETVQGETHDAIVVALGSEATHGEIAAHLVNHLTFAQHLDFHVIQERMVGSPTQEVLRHVHFYGLSIDGFPRCYGLPFIGNLHLIEVVFRRVGKLHVHTDRCLIEIRRSDQVLDVIFRHKFEPHGLPDTRHGSVENAMRLDDLLSMRDIAAVGRVPNTDYHVVLFPL